jgi:hypothetical protein
MRQCDIYQPKELVTLQRNQRLQVVGSGSPDKVFAIFKYNSTVVILANGYFGVLLLISTAMR